MRQSAWVFDETPGTAWPAARGNDPGPAVGPFPLRDTDDRASMVVQLIPVRRSAHDIVTGSYALLALTPAACVLKGYAHPDDLQHRRRRAW